eukprot:TRINITY_DN3677_c0_g1_i1.p1 TRINITY_DN3677_c0_g1~~TRINITY_DN3677_c0_g1_i1.p1  ORF type:complete len:192 (-),score=15.58 TRINITY_DN3677_c0_g1_i1:107-682(-)
MAYASYYPHSPATSKQAHSPRFSPPKIPHTVKYAWCLACGKPHRWGTTPHMQEPKGRLDASELFYCRPCKRKSPRQVRSQPPEVSEVQYPSYDLWWYCKVCGAKEVAGKPEGSTVEGHCPRCSQQTTFEVRAGRDDVKAGPNRASDKALYCRGCHEEEIAMKWENEGAEVELYCENCCGSMLWVVKRRTVW